MSRLLPDFNNAIFPARRRILVHDVQYSEAAANRSCTAPKQPGHPAVAGPARRLLATLRFLEVDLTTVLLSFWFLDLYLI